LSGLEKTVYSAINKRTDKVNCCTYADDFIITGVSKELLENRVKPVVENFLSERGLTVSTTKTKITHIDAGFDFLGIHFRKYKGKLIRKPSKKSVKAFLGKIRETIKSNPNAKTENLIHLLNPQIRGWVNYYQHICAKRTFNYVDHQIFKALWRWIKRRHRGKSNEWRMRKYFRQIGFRNWIFSAIPAKGTTQSEKLDLILANRVPIKRHIKIRAEANPYDPKYDKYFEERKYYRWRSGMRSKKPHRTTLSP
jgi:RNA-directed DNA polymerase